MRVDLKNLFFLSVFILASCGKKGDLVYEEESAYPRSYPSSKTLSVALGQQGVK